MRSFAGLGILFLSLSVLTVAPLSEVAAADLKADSYATDSKTELTLDSYSESSLAGESRSLVVMQSGASGGISNAEFCTSAYNEIKALYSVALGGTDPQARNRFLDLVGVSSSCVRYDFLSRTRFLEIQGWAYSVAGKMAGVSTSRCITKVAHDSVATMAYEDVVRVSADLTYEGTTSK